jgi:hypothetical protein
MRIGFRSKGIGLFTTAAATRVTPRRREHVKYIGSARDTLAMVVSVITAIVIGLFFAPAPANAASGGGCSGYMHGLTTSRRACISAPSYGRVAPDGYVNYLGSQRNCAVTVYGVRALDRYIMSRATYACKPSGVQGAYRYTAPRFSASSGSYYAAVMVEKLTWVVYSPRLYMP